jgi:diguanylate cyclase (GGDEF)-like protein/PAS domain S-box-containing protein
MARVVARHVFVQTQQRGLTLSNEGPIRSQSRTDAPHFRLLWETSADAVILIDEHSTIHYANPALQEIFGHEPDAAVGSPLAMLQPERLREQDVGFHGYLKSGTRQLDWRALETVGLHRNGHEFPLEVSFSDLEIDGQRMYAGFLRDISLRVRAESLQAALYKISEAAHSAPDLPGLFPRIHEVISELLPARNFYVALYDASTDLISFPYYIDEFDPQPAPRKLKEGRGVTDVVLRSGEPLLLSPETASDWAMRHEVELIGTDGVDWLGIPLKTSRGTIGVLTVQTYSGSHRYTEKDKDLLQFVSDQVAAAVERAQHNEDQRLAKVVFEQSIEGLMVTDIEQRVLMVNQSFEQLTGFSAGDVVGQVPNFLDSGHDDPTLQAVRRDSLASTGRWKGELWGKRKSGEIYPLAMSVTTVNDANGLPSHYISILTDVSDQKIQAARIEQLAFYDSLTGLPNRVLFLDRLEKTLAASKRHGGQGAILYLDLDRFKEINDSQGHAVGDLALAEVARRLQGATRKEETLARLGGDEFVIIAENADHQAAVRIARRLQRALTEPLELAGNLYTVGASIGIAFYPADGQSSQDLIKRTDIAMYRAKASGGGYRLYHTEMGAELEKRLRVAQRLGQALEAGELQLHYQPQVELGSGRVIGAEALLRWHDPVLGWISPEEFIPIAEERGMMGALGDWVLREACRQVTAWELLGVKIDGKMAINVSALQMEDPDIVGRLLEIVHEANLTPDRFELELTESAMMVDPERAVEVLELLSAAGFGLSIDDFGTGYSSLAYLKRFAADQIKIDISFIRNMLTDSDDHTIVTTIIAMARSLGLQTTAEGVEEAGQAAALLTLGCDSVQGFHFGHPEPAGVFMERWLNHSSKETSL